MSLQSLLPDILLKSILFRLVLASLLGAIIGFERDIHGRAAGLRTNLLVSLGSAIFVVLSESIAVSYSQQISDAYLRADPSRIAAQIITGIGFLGAGAIIKSGLTIRGLTTAACLWISAGIGMSAGAGYIDIGISATAISLFALIVLNKFERFYSKDSYRLLNVETSNQEDITKIINVLKRENLRIIYLDKEKNYSDNVMKICFTLKLRHKDITDKVSHEIVSDLEASDLTLYSIKWTHQ